MEGLGRPVELVKGFWHECVETLFPRFCLRCRKEGTAWCDVCDESYVLRAAEGVCPFCGETGSDQTCVACRTDSYLDGLSALTYYADPIVRRAITTWKYYGDPAYEAVLERWLRKGSMRLTFPALPFVITYVPLHIRRRRARGFDQGESISQMLADVTGLEALPLLARSVHTPPQAQRRHADRRLGDLDGVFRSAQIVPRHVILCDDVFTSGVTMDAAARCLKEAGAETVWGFVIGRGKAS